MKYLFVLGLVLGSCAAQMQAVEIVDLWETNEMFDRLQYQEVGCDCDEEAGDFMPAVLKHEVCPTHYRVMVDESR